MTSAAGRRRRARDGRRSRRRLRPEAVDVPPAVRRQRARRHGAPRRARRVLRVAPVRRREAEVPERDARAGRARLDRVRHVLRRPARNAELDRAGAVRRALGHDGHGPLLLSAADERHAAALQRRARLDRPRRHLTRLGSRPQRLGAQRGGSRRTSPRSSSTGKPYISEGLVTRSDAKRVVIMAVPTRDASGRVSGVLAGAMELRQSRTSQRSIDLGFEGLVVIDRAGQQITLASFAHPENRALLAADPQGRRRACRHHRPRGRHGPRRRIRELTRGRLDARTRSPPVGSLRSRPPELRDRDGVDPRGRRDRACHRRVGHRPLPPRDRRRAGAGSPLGRARAVAWRGVCRRRGVGGARIVARGGVPGRPRHRRDPGRRGHRTAGSGPSAAASRARSTGARRGSPTWPGSASSPPLPSRSSKARRSRLWLLRSTGRSRIRRARSTRCRCASRAVSRSAR